MLWLQVPDSRRDVVDSVMAEFLQDASGFEPMSQGLGFVPGGVLHLPEHIRCDCLIHSVAGLCTPGMALCSILGSLRQSAEHAQDVGEVDQVPAEVRRVLGDPPDGECGVVVSERDLQRAQCLVGLAEIGERDALAAFQGYAAEGFQGAFEHADGLGCSARFDQHVTEVDQARGLSAYVVDAMPDLERLPQAVLRLDETA